MRPLLLHLRAYGVPAAFAAVVASAVLFDVLFKDPNPRVAALAIALAVAAASTSLAPPDPELERTTAVRWPRRRAVHLVAMAVVVIGLFVNVDFVVRVSVGLTGLAALGVSAFGARLGWAMPAAWAGLTLLFPLPPTVPVSDVWNWMLQETTAGTLTAVVLGVAGLATYALNSARTASLTSV